VSEKRSRAAPGDGVGDPTARAPGLRGGGHHACCGQSWTSFFKGGAVGDLIGRRRAVAREGGLGRLVGEGMSRKATGTRDVLVAELPVDVDEDGVDVGCGADVVLVLALRRVDPKRRGPRARRQAMAQSHRPPPRVAS
jgi:hypothetical protein